MKTFYYSLSFFALTLAASCSKEINSSAKSSSTDNSSGLVTRTSLVAWYTFNGDVLDHSIYGNNVAFNSATATAGKDGDENTAYYFDGSTGYMKVPNSATLNGKHGITLAAVVNPLGFYKGEYHSNRILQKGFQDQSNGAYFLGFDDYASGNNTGDVADSLETFYGTYGDNQYNSIGVRDESDFIKKNRWYTIVFTVDTNRVGKLYINGELKGTASNSNSDFTPNSDDLVIGKTLNAQYPYWFHGIIDEIRIYNRAYDQNAVGEISRQMNK